MAGGGRFGSFFKQKRIELGMTLREFCRKNGFDPGNISKVERGLLPPPHGEDVKKKYAAALGLKMGTDDWLTFFDLAAAEAGIVPEDIMSDEELLKKLPLLFRTVRGSDLTEEKLRELIEAIRRGGG